MKNTDKLLKFLGSSNVFKKLYEDGGTQKEIKKQIVTTLQPFFSNREILNEIAINILVPDYINLNRLREKYTDIDKDIKVILSTYSDALSTNSELVYKTISELVPEIVETGNKFWSFVHLERDKSDMELYEFAKESFENIEDIIEGIMKAQIIEHIAINRIIRKKPFELSKIKSTKLGVLIQELIQQSPYPKLFMTQPDGIKLSDWRNIAAHKSYQVQTDSVHCRFGSGTNETSFYLSREELFNRVNQIVRMLEVLNLSHKFFGFDNIYKIQPRQETDQNTTAGRDEIWLLIFISSICSQGFEVLKFNYEADGKALMVVKDLTEQDPQMRGIHTSQFIYQIWLETRAREISIEYMLRDGQLYLRSSSNSEVCEKIYKNSRPFEYLGEKVVFEIFETS